MRKEPLDGLMNGHSLTASPSRKRETYPLLWQVGTGNNLAQMFVLLLLPDVHRSLSYLWTEGQVPPAAAPGCLLLPGQVVGWLGRGGRLRPALGQMQTCPS